MTKTHSHRTLTKRPLKLLALHTKETLRFEISLMEIAITELGTQTSEECQMRRPAAEKDLHTLKDFPKI